MSPTKKKYSIVEFIGNYNPKLIDLVPSSWVRTMKGKMLIQFPDKNEYRVLKEMIEKLQRPKKSWKLYEVKVLQTAAKYDQGMRRLERLQSDTMAVASTDDENTNPNIIEKTLVPLEPSDEDALFNVKVNGATDVHYSSTSSESGDLDDDTGESSDDAEASDSVSEKSDSTKQHVKSKTSKEGSSQNTAKSICEINTSGAATPKRKRTELSGRSTPASVSDSSLHVTPKRAKPESAKEILSVTPKRQLTIHNPGHSASNIIATERSTVMISSPRVAPSGSEEQTHDETLVPGSGVDNNNIDWLKFETVIAERIESARKSLAYDMRKQFKGLTTLLTKRLDEAGIQPIMNPLRELDVQFPINTLQAFTAFDESLGEESREKLLIHLMTTWCSMTNVADAVASIMSRLLDKDVQLLFSGVGKREKYGGKKNFSATKSFHCMILTIMDRLKEEKSATTVYIQQCTTKWLARADDRKGGRKAREAAKKSVPLPNVASVQSAATADAIPEPTA